MKKWIKEKAADILISKSLTELIRLCKLKHINGFCYPVGKYYVKFSFELMGEKRR